MNDDIIVLLDQWLIDDDFCEKTNSESLICAAIDEIQWLRKELGKAAARVARLEGLA